MASSGLVNRVVAGAVAGGGGVAEAGSSAAVTTVAIPPTPAAAHADTSTITIRGQSFDLSFIVSLDDARPGPRQFGARARAARKSCFTKESGRSFIVPQTPAQ